jgi:Tfp pilus assembly protein PilN
MKPVEFLPERIRQQRARRRRLIRRGYLLGACVLAMAVLTCFRQGRIRQARAELADLNARAGSVHQQIDTIAPLQQQMADLLIKKRIDEELGSRTDCSAVLAELCRLVPVNMALVSLELKTVEWRADAPRPPPRGGRAAEATRKENQQVVRRIRLIVTGLAPTDVDVANFIGQLSASPLFEDVNMGYAKTVAFAGRWGREFQASCYLTR